ncbi:CAAX amino terminal protease self- immunity [bacterium BMS3Abin05]|nr:CAAX amino terminal protease self- immunity [bacterium BMS3Abin05]GBE27802.1 CAAX amino terminal protease self- immunity [bacterium BMS3Bbin03]
MALSLAGIFVLIPFELGFLLYQKRLTGKTLFNGVIQYCQRIPTWQYFVWVPVVFLLSALLFTLFRFTSGFIITLFNWLPAGMFLDMGLSNDYSTTVLIVTYGFLLIFIVLILPTLEEFYFRGYLLPRMPSNLKGWTPLIHSALFSLYHIWTPWMFVARTLGVLPLVYIVKRKRNIYLGIIVHCLLNSVDFIVGVHFILNRL